MNKINHYYLDMITVGIMLSLTVIRDLTAMLSISYLIMWTGVVLVVLYLFTYRWINKPTVSSRRNNIFTVLYGIGLALFAAAYVQELTYGTGGGVFTIWAFEFIAGVILLDVIIYALKKSITINRATIVRVVVLASLTAVIWRIPIERRFLYTHRNNTQFKEFYEANKSEYSFIKIKFLYEQEHGPF